MQCDYCGARVDATATRCPDCGELIKKDEVEIKKEKHQKVWDVFAKLGFILGIISFALSFLSFLGYAVSLGVVPIVFSALGFKSLKNKDKAKRGLGFSIASLAITFVGMFAYYIFYILVLYGMY